MGIPIALSITSNVGRSADGANEVFVLWHVMMRQRIGRASTCLR